MREAGCLDGLLGATFLSGVALLSLAGCGGGGGDSVSSAAVVGSSSSQSSASGPTVTLTVSQPTVPSGGSATLNWTSSNATSCTASGAWSGTYAPSGSQSTGILTTNSNFTLICTGAGGSSSAPITVSVSIASVNSGLCGGTSADLSWVYYAGVLSPNWPQDHDLSWGGLQFEYTDTTGSPLSPPYDIKVTGPIYGGWQPASLNWNFDVTGCRYLTFALKPTVANQTWHSAFLYVGDIATGITFDVTDNAAYGPTNPVVGQWNVYKIPLADYFPGGVVPDSIYKFFIQDTSGNAGANNVWYIDNVGFLGS